MHPAIIAAAASFFSFLLGFLVAWGILADAEVKAWDRGYRANGRHADALAGEIARAIEEANNAIQGTE